jgi:hypothetical protein
MAQIAAMRKQEKGGEGFSLDTAIMHFEAVWPGLFREGEIGWGYFWMLYQCIPLKMAMDRVNMTRAIGIALGGDESKREWEADRREARLNG